MNFKVGMFVEYKHIKGYINCITSDYFTICVNTNSGNLDCCVLCYKQNWKEVILHEDVPPVYPKTCSGFPYMPL